MQYYLGQVCQTVYFAAFRAVNGIQHVEICLMRSGYGRLQNLLLLTQQIVVCILLLSYSCASRQTI